MAPTPSASRPKGRTHPPRTPKPHKLAPLPPSATITKRPLLHPPIPSPYTGASQPKVLYISPSTPFVSTIKRVRKLLAQIEKRATGPIDLVSGQGNDKQKLRELGQKMEKGKAGAAGEGEEVLLKGTGRAIQRVLELGLFFQGQGDLEVRVRTGTVGTVDDIEVEEQEAEEGETEREEVPEARVRMVSFVEVGVSLR